MGCARSLPAPTGHHGTRAHRTRPGPSTTRACPKTAAVDAQHLVPGRRQEQLHAGLRNDCARHRRPSTQAHVPASSFSPTSSSQKPGFNPRDEDVGHARCLPWVPAEIRGTWGGGDPTKPWITCNDGCTQTPHAERSGDAQGRPDQEHERQLRLDRTGLGRIETRRLALGNGNYAFDHVRVVVGVVVVVVGGGALCGLRSR